MHGWHTFMLSDVALSTIARLAYVQVCRVRRDVSRPTTPYASRRTRLQSLAHVRNVRTKSHLHEAQRRDKTSRGRGSVISVGGANARASSHSELRKEADDEALVYRYYYYLYRSGARIKQHTLALAVRRAN